MSEEPKNAPTPRPEKDSRDCPPGAALSPGLSRRRFLRDATFTGAALGASSLFAQNAAAPGEPTAAPTPLTSLAGPASAAPPDAKPLAPPDKQPPYLEIPHDGKKLGWAIVGLGELALGEILPAFARCESSQPTAVVSGHPKKARAVAAAHGIDSASIYDYENFDQIRDNPLVDVIYIVLPNSMHADFTIRGLKAGKNVLCEKPMAVTTAECEAMIAAAEGANRKLGVAYRLHYEPMNLAVMEMCRRKELGTLKTFTSSNCQNVEAPNIRLSAPLGGGPVGDVGIYCINAARYVFDEEPLEAIAISTQPKSDPRFREVPETVVFLLRYPSGVTAACECSFGTARSSRYQVLCQDGTITMDPAYAYRGLRLEKQEKIGGDRRCELEIEPVNQFAAEMDAFSTCVLQDKPIPTPGEMGLRDIRIVLAVLESARLGGQPVKIA